MACSEKTSKMTSSRKLGKYGNHGNSCFYNIMIAIYNYCLGKIRTNMDFHICVDVQECKSYHSKTALGGHKYLQDTGTDRKFGDGFCALLLEQLSQPSEWHHVNSTNRYLQGKSAI